MQGANLAFVSHSPIQVGTFAGTSALLRIFGSVVLLGGLGRGCASISINLGTGDRDGQAEVTLQS
jgi:hypothetical protein